MAKTNRPTSHKTAAPKASDTPVRQTEPTKKEGPNWLGWLLLLVVVAATALLYRPSLNNGFTNLDDDVYVTNNPDLAWNGKNLRTLASKEVAGNFHPLTMWSLALDRGSEAQKVPAPEPFHRTNLWLHLLNVALTFGLALRLRSGVWVAAVIALFFGIHPLHVESVAWVAGRKDVLYTAFFLSGLLVYTYARERSQNGPRTGLWLLVFAFFVLSALSKPAAIVFPLVLLLLDWYLAPYTTHKAAGHTLSQTIKGNLVWLIPFLLVSAFFAYQTLRYQQHVGAVAEQYTFGRRCLFAAYGLVIYPVKLLWPFHLSAMHPAPGPTDPLHSSLLAAPLGAIGILGALAWAYFKKRGLFLGLSFYLINVLLVLGFIKVGSALYAERYTYVAYTGLFWVMAVGGQWLWMRGALGRAATVTLFTALTVLFALRTNQQITIWRNSDTLWTQIIDLYPTPTNLSYRGYHYYLDQQYEKALADFDRANALKANDETTLHIRALCLEKLGRLEESWAAFAQYEKQFPPNKDVLFHAGNCLMGLKRYPEAIERYARVTALDPKHLDALNNQANAWFNLKNYEKAEMAFSSALAVQPDFLQGLNNRGAARLNLNKWQEAIADFTKSLAIDPNQGQIFRYRSMALDRLGRKQEAAVDKAEAAKRGQ